LDKIKDPAVGLGAGAGSQWSDAGDVLPPIRAPINGFGSNLQSLRSSFPGHSDTKQIFTLIAMMSCPNSEQHHSVADGLLSDSLPRNTLNGHEFASGLR
jgi:hypothetical protein